MARASAPLAGQSPIGFIRPCEPTLVDCPAAGPIWSHEIKHDGFRILARKQGKRVQFWSRAPQHVPIVFVGRSLIRLAASTMVNDTGRTVARMSSSEGTP